MNHLYKSMLVQEAEMIATLGLEKWKRLDDILRASAARKAEQARAGWMKRGVVQPRPVSRPEGEPSPEIVDGVRQILEARRFGARQSVKSVPVGGPRTADESKNYPAETS